MVKRVLVVFGVGNLLNEACVLFVLKAAVDVCVGYCRSWLAMVSSDYFRIDMTVKLSEFRLISIVGVIAKPVTTLPEQGLRHERRQLRR